MNAEKENAILRAYADGMPVLEIAAQLHVGTCTISNTIKANGAKMRGRGAKRRWPVIYPEIQERMERDGLRFVDIAQRANYTPNAVGRALTGRAQLTRTMAMSIAGALGENYLDLFGDIEDRRDTEWRLRERSRSGGNAT